ncbi:MAG: PspC domain-containing protein [Bacteroides sp.]|nr:PspC domain-containing protein [Bacteroides sp.]
MSNEKKFRRSRTDRKLAGVCAGIANFFGLDATLIRVVYALATLFTAFAGLIIYIILWLIVPEE